MALSALPLFHRIAGRRVVLIGDGSAAEAKRRLIERAGGVCCPETEAHHARLAFVAYDDPRAAEAAALRLKSKGLLVNVADRPELCDFTLPSVIERDPVLIAVGTGGASAGLAKQLRLRLEALVPQSLGGLANALAQARDALRARWPDAGDRRRALDVALAADGPLDPLREGSECDVSQWLDGAHPEPGPRTVEISLRDGDPDNLTLREARLLGTADVIVHDAKVPHGILARARADARRVPEPPSDTVHGLTLIIRSRTDA